MSLESSVVELRQYTLHSGQRDTLIELFERELISGQEAVGMNILGQFYDLDRPDHFVWIREFPNMMVRKQALEGFYYGPVWQAHREAANATMIDSDNVLLLRPIQAFSSLETQRTPNALLAVFIFSMTLLESAHEFYQDELEPKLRSTDAVTLATYITETSENDFPRLPIRIENVLVWFVRFADEAALEQHRSALEQSSFGTPEILRLKPTERSRIQT